MKMKPGTYDVKAKGHGSSYMPMKVTLSEDKIKDIKVDSSGETKGVADEVFNRLPKLIVANQTLNVDAVSGATISSHGVVDGVAEAINEAGGNADEWKNRAKPAKKNVSQNQEYNTDVVVIGAGGAGLAAAARSIQHGRKVIILEKFPQIGGNTTRAGGPMNAAQPEWQKKILKNLQLLHLKRLIQSIAPTLNLYKNKFRNILIQVLIICLIQNCYMKFKPTLVVNA